MDVPPVKRIWIKKIASIPATEEKTGSCVKGTSLSSKLKVQRLINKIASIPATEENTGSRVKGTDLPFKSNVQRLSSDTPNSAQKKQVSNACALLLNKSFSDGEVFFWEGTDGVSFKCNDFTPSHLGKKMHILSAFCRSDYNIPSLTFFSLAHVLKQ